MSFDAFNIIMLISVMCCIAENDVKNLSLKYYVSFDLQNWMGAFINCKNAGMELVSIPTEADQENLEKFMLQHGYDEGYWTSATNLGNGNYYWASTGNAVVYMKWLPNQPDNASLPENKHRGEHCIQWGIYRTSPKPIGWNDLACSYKLRYICQETITCD